MPKPPEVHIVSIRPSGGLQSWFNKNQGYHRVDGPAFIEHRDGNAATMIWYRLDCLFKVFVSIDGVPIAQESYYAASADYSRARAEKNAHRANTRVDRAPDSTE